jgi:hypothetical protein
MTRKYTFKKEGLTCWIWSDSLVTATDMVGYGWGLFTIDK